LRASGRTVKAELKAIWFEKANDDASDAVPPRRVRSISATAARSHSRGLRHAIESTLGVTKAWPLQSLAAAAVHRAAQGPERGERSAVFLRRRLSHIITANATRR
jgi:hypothetical protein